MVLAVLFLILKYIAVLKKFNLLLERIRDSEVNDVRKETKESKMG